MITSSEMLSGSDLRKCDTEQLSQPHMLTVKPAPQGNAVVFGEATSGTRCSDWMAGIFYYRLPGLAEATTCFFFPPFVD